MKTAVVTVAIGPRHEAIGNMTHQFMKDYAAKIGAEFIVIKDGVWPDPTFEKLRLFQLLNKFHRIILFDTDVLVRADCPNLFDIVPEGSIGVFNEGGFVDRAPQISEVVKECAWPVEKWERQYYNLGVMVVSRQHKFLFANPEKDVRVCNALINLRIIRDKIKVHDLSYKFNRMQYVDALTGEHRRASYIVHYATGKNVPFEQLLQIIKSDILSWQQEAPNFAYKRHIVVKTHGGLGDQICAEPVIRYMAEKAYKDAHITVCTWYPRVFSHLPVEVVGIFDFKPEFDTPYFLMETLVGPEKPCWQFMSANLMSATDFMSQMCLRMILPDDAKQIKMKVGLEEISEVIDVVGIRSMSDIVLVHPGKGWDSKSFPASWWSEVVRLISEAGFQVVVIGKDLSEEQGTIEIDVPKGVIDARNLLGLGGLIGLISQARVLVSNDSSPVHIAGAFDNHIILIPTCKHPDHVLPFRNGNRYYKADSLCKKLMFDSIDSSPTQIHGQTIDKVPGNIEDFLPDPKDVLEAVKKGYGK